MFTGRVAYADINAYYSLLDVFVVPRRHVGVARLVTPLKPYEAMAMERAVVVSRVDALMEHDHRKGRPGSRSRRMTPSTWRTCWSRCWSMRSAGRRWAGRPAAWVREHRSWRRNAELYLELYRAWARRDDEPRAPASRRIVVGARPELHQGRAGHPGAGGAGRAASASCTPASTTTRCCPTSSSGTWRCRRPT